MYLAFERLLPRVRPQVHHKLRLDGKLLLAVIADVGLLGALRPLRPLLLLHPLLLLRALPRALCEWWDEARRGSGEAAERQRRGSGEAAERQRRGIERVGYREDEKRHGSGGRRQSEWI